jgi:hypothetical protein
MPSEKRGIVNPYPPDPDIGLVFRPLPDPEGVPVAVRVRRLLKYALRALRLKCVRLGEARSDHGKKGK